MTLSYEFRLAQLQAFYSLMHEQEEVLLDALNKDLGKTKPEAYMTEIMLVKNAVSDAIYNLKEWMRYG